MESLEIQRRLLGEDDHKVLASLNNLATIASNTGGLDGALRAQEDWLARRRRLFGTDDATFIRLAPQAPAIS